MRHIVLLKRGTTYIVAFLAAILFFFVIALPAFAGASLDLTPEQGLPGTAFTASGSEFIPGTVVAIRWGSKSGPILASAPVGPGGEFSANVSVPSGAGAGKAEVWACGAPSAIPNTCDKDFVRKSADFRVLSTTTTVPTTTSTTNPTTTTVPATTTTTPATTTTTPRSTTTTRPGTTTTKPGATSSTAPATTTSTTIPSTSITTAPPPTSTGAASSTNSQLQTSVQGIEVSSDPDTSTTSPDPDSATRDGSIIELGGTVVAAGETPTSRSGLAILIVLGVALTSVLAIGYQRNKMNQADRGN